jgi:hypothetical protein
MATEDEVREVKRRYAPQLLGQRGVSGVGVEKDESGGYVLAIHLDTDDPEVRKVLPDQIEGHRVRYLHSGPFRKLPASEGE